MKFLIRILFPPKCVLCRRVLRLQQTDLCDSCRKDMENWVPTKRNHQFLDSFVALWYYEGYARGSILRYKFHGARYLAKSYGRLLGMRILESGHQDVDVLTWVPVSPLRRLIRGYDQSQLLAKAVGMELGIPVVQTLKKIRHNKQQSGLQGIAQRRANVLGVYRCVNMPAFQGKRVLLLDDVLTTGATAGECARMLLTAGAKEVHCAAIAAVRK